jgi:Tfp pilus assembly protein PilP
MRDKRMLLRTCFLVLLAMAVTFAACGKKAAPPPAAPAPVQVAPKPAAAAAVEEEKKVETVAFRYVPEDVRDPFVSLLDIKKAELVEIDPETLPPLQRVPVTDMTLEGVILMGKKSVAHVITPDGKAHIVSLGMGMGRNNGRVVRILSDSIVVDEEFENYLGKKFSQETVLRLRQKEEGETL